MPFSFLKRLLLKRKNLAGIERVYFDLKERNIKSGNAIKHSKTLKI